MWARETEIVAAHLGAEPRRGALVTAVRLQEARAVVEQLGGRLGHRVTAIERPVTSGEELIALLRAADDPLGPSFVALAAAGAWQGPMFAAVVDRLWREGADVRVLVAADAFLRLPSDHGSWLYAHLEATDLDSTSDVWQARAALAHTATLLERIQLEPVQTPAASSDYVKALHARRSGTDLVGQIMRDIEARLEQLTLADWDVRTGAATTVDIAPALAEREQLEAAYQALLEDSTPAWTTRDLRSELISPMLERIARLAANPDDVYGLTPRRFEELMAELYAMQGFEVELTRGTKDGGVDLYLVRHEAYGRVLTIADCKRYAPDHLVGVGLVRAMHGLVEANRANAGLIITTSFFTRGAREFQRRLDLRLKLQDYDDIRGMLGPGFQLDR